MQACALQCMYVIISKVFASHTALPSAEMSRHTC